MNLNERKIIVSIVRDELSDLWDLYCITLKEYLFIHILSNICIRIIFLDSNIISVTCSNKLNNVEHFTWDGKLDTFKELLLNSKLIDDFWRRKSGDKN